VAKLIARAAVDAATMAMAMAMAMSAAELLEEQANDSGFVFTPPCVDPKLRPPRNEKTYVSSVEAVIFQRVLQKNSACPLLLLPMARTATIPNCQPGLAPPACRHKRAAKFSSLRH
jgi:hypothetical protein